MPYFKRKETENEWIGLSEVEYKAKLREAQQQAWEEGQRQRYAMAQAEGFRGTFEEYDAQWEFPFGEDGQANPKFEKSWDGREAERKSAEAVKEAVTLMTEQELQL